MTPPKTNEDTIREIAAKYPPEEIISAALVTMCLLIPQDPETTFAMGLAGIQVALERNQNRFFAATNTEQ